MSKFKTGEFDRDRVAKRLQPFVPARSAIHLTEVDVEALWADGKRLILLDVDNTLVEWNSDAIDPEVRGWVRRAQDRGFGLCILSNTHRVDRLNRLAESLGVSVVRGKRKPSRAMYRLALIKHGLKADQAVMIGDQIFTDVWGANRSGIDAIWVHRMDSKEFGPTKISRMGERLLQGPIYKALVVPVDAEGPAEPASAGLMGRPIVRQFLKFCVVGGTSFVIDTALRFVLMFFLPGPGGTRLSEWAGTWLQSRLPALFSYAPNAQDAFFPVAATIAAAVAILNSFYWNRLWTFQIRGREERMKQLRRFVLVSVIGLGINVAVSSFFHHILPGPDKLVTFVATALAAAVVAIWNFSGQRLYAFRPRSK